MRRCTSTILLYNTRITPASRVSATTSRGHHRRLILSPRVHEMICVSGYWQPQGDRRLLARMNQEQWRMSVAQYAIGDSSEGEPPDACLATGGHDDNAALRRPSAVDNGRCDP